MRTARTSSGLLSELISGRRRIISPRRPTPPNAGRQGRAVPGNDAPATYYEPILPFIMHRPHNLSEYNLCRTGVLPTNLHLNWPYSLRRARPSTGRVSISFCYCLGVLPRIYLHQYPGIATVGAIIEFADHPGQCSAESVHPMPLEHAPGSREHYSRAYRKLPNPLPGRQSRPDRTARPATPHDRNGTTAYK